MTRRVLLGGLSLLWMTASATLVTAGPIDQACLRSDRGSVNLAACGCIQGVADFTLGASDQRKVAKFFKDPERAEKARAADSAEDEAFWDRYETFGTQAELYCGG